MGRPSSFNQETADKICEALIDGQSLRSICKGDEFPSVVTVCKWVNDNEAFAKQYARARELQADALFDDCLAISDNKHPDALDTVEQRRTQIDTRKWMAGKLKGKYSDRPTDDQGNPLLPGGNVTVNVAVLNDEQLRSLASIPILSD